LNSRFSYPQLLVHNAQLSLLSELTSASTSHGHILRPGTQRAASAQAAEAALAAATATLPAVTTSCNSMSYASRP
jgi:hypothetical protein